MQEIRTGFRKILSNPQVYAFLQNLLRGKASKCRFINDYIRPFPNMRLLDIGCGPADILADLPQNIHYVGFDASQKYIEAARNRFGSRGRFFQDYVTEASLEELGEFDLVMSLGVMHHLDDNEVHSLSALAYQAVRPEGCFLTIDPSFVSGQHWLARFLAGKDRGKNVRSPEEYESLINENIQWNTVVSVKHDLLRLPYTHVILECRK